MKILLGSLLAALVSFAWGFVSWEVLTWHEAGVHDFADEAAVAAVIQKNATNGKGLYVLPFPRKPMSYASEEDRQRLQEEHAAARDAGPFMRATVRPGVETFSMGRSLAWSAGRSLAAALILAALLSATVATWPARVAFCAAAGAFAGLTAVLPQMIWFELPLRETIVTMADHMVEWLLAGAVLGLFAGREPTQRDYD